MEQFLQINFRVSIILDESVHASRESFINLKHPTPELFNIITTLLHVVYLNGNSS